MKESTSKETSTKRKNNGQGSQNDDEEVYLKKIRKLNLFNFLIFFISNSIL
jgi:hypothetical protein